MEWGDPGSARGLGPLEAGAGLGLTCDYFFFSFLLPPQQAGSVLCRGINPTRTFYILNPQNNLPSTEERFRSWFER